MKNTNEEWQYSRRQRDRISRLGEIRTDLQNVITELTRKTRDDRVPVDLRIVEIAHMEIEEFSRVMDNIVNDRIEMEENSDDRKAPLSTAVE